MQWEDSLGWWRPHCDAARRAQLGHSGDATCPSEARLPLLPSSWSCCSALNGPDGPPSGMSGMRGGPTVGAGSMGLFSYPGSLGPF